METTNKRTKKQRILENIENRYKLKGDDAEVFYENAIRYIKAIKENRVICIIDTVSASGMSRTLKFLECAKYKNEKRYAYLNFYSFFKNLGYNAVRSSNFFRIYGCGMDMVFHTNYSNIHDLKRLGFISKRQCDKLAQMTPTVA